MTGNVTVASNIEAFISVALFLITTLAAKKMLKLFKNYKKIQVGKYRLRAKEHVTTETFYRFLIIEDRKSVV